MRRRAIHLSHSVPTQQGRCRQQRGFTLLEYAAVLALTSSLIFALFYKTGDVATQISDLTTQSMLEVADEQLRYYAAWNGRLPCPDADLDGIEDCEYSKGYLPYRTLGMGAVGYHEGHEALRYGVYRNDGATADLAIKEERFDPTSADGETYSLGNENSLDFCTGLTNAAGQAVSTDYLYQARPDGSNTALAYMLAQQGDTDADGVNGQFDGLNGESGNGFEAPETAQSTTYDDTTLGRGFDELYGIFHCEVTQRSLDLAATAITLEEDVEAFAESNADSAEQGVVSNAVSALIGAWSVYQAAAMVAEAATHIATASSLLAGATATCAVPPFVGCALVPVYSAAVTAASVSQGLAVSAVTLSGLAVAAQVATAIWYDQIADETGLDDTSSSTGISTDAIDGAFEEYETADAEADAAEAVYASALEDYYTAATATDTARAALDDLLGEVSSGIASAAGEDLYNQTYGYEPAGYDEEDDSTWSGYITGATAALDALVEAEANLSDADDLVDENGDPIEVTDEDGNSVALDDLLAEAVEEAQTSYDAELAAAQALANAIDAYDQARLSDDDEARSDAASALTALVPEFSEDTEDTGGLCGSEACNLNAALTAYLEAYEAEREAWYTAETLREEAETLRDVADGEYDTYGALVCAADGKDYDSDTDSCTDDEPGSAALDNATETVCDTSSVAYDETTCSALTDSSSSGEGTLVTYNTGAEDIVDTLDSKGTVR